VVRRAGPPYDSLGVDQDPQALSAGQVHKTELVFEATESAAARVDFYAQVQRELEIRDVSLRRLSGGSVSSDPPRSAVQLVNLSDAPRSYTCAESGLASCVAVDEDGRAIKWPLTVEARATALVLSP